MKKIKITGEQAQRLGLNKSIPKTLKEGVRNVVKISKEQYNRIFAAGLITEDEVKGGLNRVDKEFKREFVGKDVQSLSPTTPMGEGKFKVEKPNPSLNKGNQGQFNKPISEGDNQIKNEVKELIKFLYRKSEELSPFWEKQGISYDEICDSLTSKGLIVSKNGKYEVSKKLGSPQAALQAIEDQLSTLLPKQQGADEAYPMQDAPKTDAPQTDAPQTDAPQTDAPSLETENTPVGADEDPKAPWNDKGQDITKPTEAKEAKLEPVGFNNEIIIFKDPKGILYVFFYDGIDKKEFMQYASVERHYVGKDDEGQPDYDYDFDNANVDANVVSNYVNDNLATLTKGEGLEAYENGAEIVKVDEPLKQELIGLYSMDKGIAKALGPIEEVTEPEAIDSFKKQIGKAFTASDKPKIPQHKILAKLAELKAKEKARQEAEKAALQTRSETGEVEEMTGAASSGAFTGALDMPVVKREMPATPVVGEASTLGKGYTHFALDKATNKIVNGWDYNGLENDEIKHWVKGDLKDQFPDRKPSEFKLVTRGFLMKNGIDPTNTENWYKIDISETTVASAGNFQYDTPGLANVGRNGEFKKGKKTKAEKTTQWAGGAFVEQPKCSKLNNNKEAQNGGCNQGAPSLKTRKTGGSINAPSLGENEIYEAIVKKTGKSIDEIKRIIESKNKKA